MDENADICPVAAGGASLAFVLSRKRVRNRKKGVEFGGPEERAARNAKERVELQP
jgi:hypothetical protein